MIILIPLLLPPPSFKNNSISGCASLTRFLQTVAAVSSAALSHVLLSIFQFDRSIPWQTFGARSSQNVREPISTRQEAWRLRLGRSAHLHLIEKDFQAAK